MKETIRFIIISLLIIIPIRMFIAEPFMVSGHSMDPTFTEKQYLIIDRLSLRFTEPKRGDVIIFKYPNNPKVYYIKRVIGLPQETVSIKDGLVTIKTSDNQEILLSDDFIKNKDQSNMQPFSLKENEYFVMGDNRPVSSDSRSWGKLDRKYIIGKPFISLFPLDRVSIFPGKI